MKAEDYLFRLDGISIENEHGDWATITNNDMLQCLLIDVIERLRKLEGEPEPEIGTYK